MSRSDVLEVNRAVIDVIVDEVLEHAPDSLLLLVTNPVDVLTITCMETHRLERRRVFGQSGVLDSARMATFMSEANRAFHQGHSDHGDWRSRRHHGAADPLLHH